MIQKEKYNIKRVLALILSLACVIGMLAGCGRQNTGESNAEGSSSEEPASDTWYEVDQEAGILTVRLPFEKEGFIWDFTINDTALLELVTEEDNDGTFVASFRALGDGETVVSFSYAKDDALEKIRAMNVSCKDGKVAGVSNASVMPISGQDDPEITDLRNSNSIPMIMKEHSAVTCVSETWDGENNWQNKTVRQFVSSDGRLWYDYEQYNDADQVVYCEAGYINDDVPGALYTFEKDGLKTMTLCPASEYEAMVSDRWLARQPCDYETVTDKTDSAEYVYQGEQCTEYVFQNTPEHLANFIGSHPEARQIIVTDEMDWLILNTIGYFIDRCHSQELLEEVKKVLIPIQMGEAEAQPFFCPTMDEMEEYCKQRKTMDMEMRR